MEDDVYGLMLAMADGIGPVKAGFLRAYFGSEEKIFSAGEEGLNKAFLELSAHHKVRFSARDINSLMNVIQRRDEIKRKLLLYEKRGIRFLSFSRETYPEKLKEIYDPPIGLFMYGNEVPEPSGYVAIVGARDASPYGLHTAFRLAYEFSARGMGVISGMAKGIDAAAHEGALKAKRMGFGKGTVAVLGCGVDICYPMENRLLYEEILKEGCVLSAFLPGEGPKKVNFPQRNRIISGMADLVVVVSAKIKSGAMITADQALEQGRDVYAVPGRVDDPLSAGCNMLIKQGAGIITDPYLFVEEYISEHFPAIGK